MKLHRTNWAAWALGALLLSACSNNKDDAPPPGPASTLTLATTDVVGTTTSITADDSNAIITAHVSAAESKTIVQICADVDNDNDCSYLIIMMIGGTTAGTYSMASPDALTQVVFHDDEAAEATGALSHYLSSGGQIVLSEVGAPGSPMRGSFDVALTCNSGCSGNITASGTFSLTRTE